jgi:hypothetical protein
MGWVARESSSGLGCGVGVVRERCSPPYRAASLALPLLMPGSAGVKMGVIRECIKRQRVI